MTGILAKIAWRNIWRSPRRSFVLITTIAIGVFSFLGSIAYIDGFSLQMITSAIELQGGHIQVTAKDYHENPTIRAYIPRAEDIESILSSIQGGHLASEVRTPGMINSAEQAAGAIIVGVIPGREPGSARIPISMIEGEYLSPESNKNEIVIGKALAKRLGVFVDEKIVLLANDLDNEIGSGAYRIAGLFRTSSADFDKAHVYLHQDQVRKLVGYASDYVSTFTFHLDPDHDLMETATGIRSALSSKENLEILTWEDRSPVLVLMNDMMGIANVVLVIILFTAIAFTLTNSFIMVIFERTREIGIMMAGGVRPTQIWMMLYLETLFIVLLGMALGSVLAFALIAWWSSVGLDLSAFAEGLSSFGAASVIYPHVDVSHLLSGFAIIFLMTLLAVLYPAIKASRFKIVDAMNGTYVP